MIKSILRSLSVTAFVISLGGAIPAAAQNTSSCTIQGTGTGSTNNCTISDTRRNNVTCNNNLRASNSNQQSATSGSANNSGNTTSGGATSGNATNQSSSNTDLSLSCAAPARTNTTPVVTNPEIVAVTPPAGGGAGQGVKSGAVLSASNTSPSRVTSLPNTGTNIYIKSMTTASIIAGVTASVSMLGASAYRRFAGI